MDGKSSVGERLGKRLQDDRRFARDIDGFVDPTGDDLLRGVAAHLVYAAPGEPPDGWDSMEDDDRRAVWRQLRPEERALILADGTIKSDTRGRAMLAAPPAPKMSGPTIAERISAYHRGRGSPALAPGSLPPPPPRRPPADG